MTKKNINITNVLPLILLITVGVGLSVSAGVPNVNYQVARVDSVRDGDYAGDAGVVPASVVPASYAHLLGVSAVGKGVLKNVAVKKNAEQLDVAKVGGSVSDVVDAVPQGVSVS